MTLDGVIELTDHVALIGGGVLGAELSDPADANIYVIHAEGEAVVVDAGCGLATTALADKARAFGDIGAVLVTHAHADHAAGAAGLAAELGASVLCSERVAKVLRGDDPAGSGLSEAQQAGIYSAEVHFTPVDPVVIGHGDRIRVGHLAVEAILTEGHADGHLAFALDVDSSVFTGDLVFARGIVALLDTPDTRQERLARSLAALLRRQPLRLYPGHGAPVMNRGAVHIGLALDPLLRGERPPSLIA